jgi:hypothetical protein
MESAGIVLLPMNKICYLVSEYVPYFAMMGQKPDKFDSIESGTT